MLDQKEITVSEIVDQRTGEIIPKGITNEVAELSFVAAPSFESVGTLELDDNAQKVLSEPMNMADIKIRPDGNVYLSWTWYASRLNRAFGIARWGLIPQGMPMSKPHGTYGDILIVWGHWLVVNGKPIGFAIGETTYKPNNAMMSYADACEGAKSNSLARNCKLLGMSLDLWDSEFCMEWKNLHAETYQDQGKTKWRKKTVMKSPQPLTQIAAPISEANQTGEPLPDIQVTSKAVVNEFISDGEWQRFGELVQRGANANLQLPEYKREKMTASLLNGATEYIKGKLAKVTK
jgi:hypothetical protein